MGYISGFLRLQNVELVVYTCPSGFALHFYNYSWTKKCSGSITCCNLGPVQYFIRRKSILIIKKCCLELGTKEEQ